MALYLSIIFIALVAIVSFDGIVATKIFQIDAWIFVNAIIISFVFIVLINIFFAIFVSILPKKWFGVSNKFFHVSKNERKFYEKLKIRKWKDKIWELGWLGGFSKSSIKEPHDPKYVERFVVESQKGIIDHVSRMIFGFAIILIFPEFAWVVGFPIAVVNFFLNLLSTLVLRYNLPKLEIMYSRLIKYSEAKQDEGSLT